MPTFACGLQTATGMDGQTAQALPPEGPLTRGDQGYWSGEEKALAPVSVVAPPSVVTSEDV